MFFTVAKIPDSIRMKTLNTNTGFGNPQVSVAASGVASSNNDAADRTAAEVAGSVHLPTLPDVASQLLQFAQQEEPDFDEMAKVIRCDPAISGKILTTVNSALFGFRTKVETIEKAIPKLGTSMVRTLILGFHLGSYRPNHELVARMLPKLWQNFLAQAVLAEMIAESTELDEARCFLAGMIQDIGVLALVSEYPDEYAEKVLQRSKFPNVLAAESSHFGFNHVDVTLEITNSWNLGDDFYEAIEHHHDRFSQGAAGESPAPTLQLVLQAAHMGASCLLGRGSKGTPDGCQLADWHSFLENHFGFDVETSTEIMKDVGARVEESSVVFGVDTGSRIDSARIANLATTLLQTIAIQTQVALSQKKTNSDEIYRDYLSGLRNRRFLSEVLSKTLSEWVRKRKSMAMFFIDADGFKQVNDTYGHGTGDKLIKHIANWLESTTRSGDYVLRLGGDEFLIAAQIKHSFCEKLCNRIVKDAPALVTDDGEKIPISLSVGCVFYEPARKDDVDPNWIIDQADQLMYETKRGGGQNVKIMRIDGKKRMA